MRAFCLMLLRFCLAAWVGAALLFVATSVAEQVSPRFDASTKNSLTTIRFPIYYAAGHVMLTLAFVASLLAGPLRGGRRTLIALLTLLALGIMLAEYRLIYQPLERMMLSQDVSRDAEFARYHTLSKYVNLGELVLALLAAGVACWPAREERT